MKEVLILLERMLMDERDTKAYRSKGLRHTCIKTIMGDIEFERRMYQFNTYEANVTNISYRNTAKNIKELTSQDISHTAVWNVVQKLGSRIGEKEERKILKILEKVQELAEKNMISCNCEGNSTSGAIKPVISSIEIIKVENKDPNKVKLDKAGYFVIVPKAESNVIFVEHYSNANQLLRIIKGEDARNIYWTIIENGWVCEMSHAAYLGKELTRAEISMKMGFRYVQDKA